MTATTLGTTIDLTAEAVECGPSCAIFGAGESKGNLRYTGVKVVKPSKCTVGNPGGPEGTFTTNALHDQIIMDPSNGTGPVFDKFTAVSGAWFELEFHGEECALNEFALPVEGSAAVNRPTRQVSKQQNSR